MAVGPGQPIAPLAIPTLVGACVGTPRYASPEQARGARVDPRTDIYAAGIVLYTLIAGRGPFDEVKGAGNILQAHISEEPPPPSRFTKYPIGPALESVILRAIAKHPDDRFSDAASFSRELLVTMGKLCLPLELEPTPGDIGMALGEPCPRWPADACATVLALPRPRPDPNETPRSRVQRVTRPLGKDLQGEVLLSAVAFAALAGGVAMWFVH